MFDLPWGKRRRFGNEFAITHGNLHLKTKTKKGFTSLIFSTRGEGKIIIIFIFFVPSGICIIQCHPVLVREGRNW